MPWHIRGMGDSDNPPHQWTAALVLAELRRALARPVIRAPPQLALLPDPEDALPPLDLIKLAQNVLGRGTGEHRALLILARPPDTSIRQLCRDLGLSWATVNRRGMAGAAAVAERLNADGITVPKG
jgi:hypothetical protein